MKMRAAIPFWQRFGGGSLLVRTPPLITSSVSQMRRLARLVVVALVVALILDADHVAAKMPPDVCICENGATRAATSYCSCEKCPSPYVGPFCSVTASEFATIAITYDNSTSTTLFALDNAEKKLRNGLGVGAADLSWLSRAPGYEQKGEVVVLYSIKGSLLTQLFTDINAASKPSYVAEYPKILDAWQTGLKVSPASRMSQHWAKSDILGEHDLGFSIGGSSSKNAVLVICAAHLEFFIGALVVLVVTPLVEGLLLKFMRKTDDQLDEEVATHGGDDAVDELARRRLRIAGISAETASGEMVNKNTAVNPLKSPAAWQQQPPPPAQQPPQPAVAGAGGMIAAAVLAEAALEQQQRHEQEQQHQHQHHLGEGGVTEMPHEPPRDAQEEERSHNNPENHA